MKIAKPDRIVLPVELEDNNLAALYDVIEMLEELCTSMKEYGCVEAYCIDGYNNDIFITIDTLKTVKKYLNHLKDIIQINN